MPLFLAGVFWLLVLCLCEVSVTRRLLDVLTLLLVVILLLVALVLGVDLDLLGALVLLTYTSVFVLLNLLILHVATFDSRADVVGVSSKPLPGLWLLVVGVLFIFLGQALTPLTSSAGLA